MAFEIIASINTAGSIKEISDKLSNEVANGVNSKMPLKIVATIDTQKTINQINNSLSSISGISIKNINIDSATNGMKQQFKNVTNDIVNQFNNNFKIKGNNALNTQIKDLLNQFTSGDISKSTSALSSLTQIIEKQSSVVIKNKEEFDNLQAVIRSFGKIHIDQTLKSDLDNLVGSGNKARSILDNLFGGYKKGVGRGWSAEFKKGYGDFSALLEQDGRLKTFTADAEGLLNLFNRMNNLQSSNPINYFDAIGLSGLSNMKERTLNVQNYISELLKVDTANSNIKNSNNTLISNYENLKSKLNETGTSVKVTEEEFKRLQTISSNGLANIKIIDNSGFKFLENELGVIKTLSVEASNGLNQLSESSKNNQNQEKSEAKDRQDYIEKLRNQTKAVADLEVKLKSLTKDSAEYSVVQKKYIEESEKLRQVKYEGFVDKGILQTIQQVEQLTGDIIKQRDYVIELNQARKQDNEQNQKIKKQEEDLKSYNNTIVKTINELNRISNLRVFDNNSTNSSVVAMRASVADLTSRFNNLKESIKEIKTPEQFEVFQKKIQSLSSEFYKVYGNAKNLRDFFISDNSTTVLGTKIQTLRGQIEKYMNVNSKAMNNGYRNQFTDMLNQLRNVSNSNEFNKIKQKFQSVTAEIDRLGLRGASVMDTLKQKISKFASWMGITMVTASVAREIRGMYSTVIELDTALVDLNKTFQGTSADLEDFYYGANKVAKQLGSTTKEVIDSASSWSRLGYSTKETSIAMAEYSSIFKSISPGMSIENATEGLVSTMKAFGIEVDDVQSQIMDNINIIGNTLSVSNADIVESLKRSSAALALGNNNIKESISLITSANEIVQNSEKVGTAIRSVSMRLRGYDEETEELSEDLKNITGEIANLTKVASNNYQGVSLFTDEANETYKSTYEIFKDIAEIWKELTDKQQAKLLEKMAGKMNSQVVGSILVNWENAEKAMRTMEESYGSSQKEMEKYYESLEYKINNFKETITGIAQSTITRDFLKGFVDDATTMLETFNNFGAVLRPLYSTIGSIVSGITGLTNALGGLDKVVAGLALSKSINGIFKGLFGADRTKTIVLISMFA